MYKTGLNINPVFDISNTQSINASEYIPIAVHLVGYFSVCILTAFIYIPRHAK